MYTDRDALVVVVVCPQCEIGEWVESNFWIIDLLVPPRAAGVAETLNLFTLQTLPHYNLGCM